MKSSILLSLLFVALLTYLLIKFNKRINSKKYSRKPLDTWGSLSEGIDPTDE
jgi:hypothetical protein